VQVGIGDGDKEVRKLYHKGSQDRILERRGMEDKTLGGKEALPHCYLSGGRGGKPLCPKGKWPDPCGGSCKPGLKGKRERGAGWKFRISDKKEEKVLAHGLGGKQKHEKICRPTSRK